jgi:hypothetical protein
MLLLQLIEFLLKFFGQMRSFPLFYVRLLLLLSLRLPDLIIRSELHFFSLAFFDFLIFFPFQIQLTICLVLLLLSNYFPHTLPVSKFAFGLGSCI